MARNPVTGLVARSAVGLGRRSIIVAAVKPLVRGSRLRVRTRGLTGALLLAWAGSGASVYCLQPFLICKLSVHDYASTLCTDDRYSVLLRVLHQDWRVSLADHFLGHFEVLIVPSEIIGTHLTFSFRWLYNDVRFLA